MIRAMPSKTEPDPFSWPDTESFRIESVTVEVYRYPITEAVQTAFGRMEDRPALIVRVTDEDGRSGLGEVWCNFPSQAAAHRFALLTEVLAPAIVGRYWRGPAAVFDYLTRRFRLLGLQAGEIGPFNHCVAGIDVALWDLSARRIGKPLWRLLGGEGNGVVLAYASGIGPDNPVDLACHAEADGHRAFKLKVGFEASKDLSNLRKLRAALGSETAIAVDANQAWSPSEAEQMIGALAPYSPVWVEEPLPADSPASDWDKLAARSPIPLAGGENLYGFSAFDEAIRVEAWAVIQPDLTKWGGITGCLPIARRILAAGRRFCPHHLGAGVGLVASAHLLATARGDGLLEIDTNPNPLRTELVQPYPRMAEGRLRLGEASGLGVTLTTSLEPFRVSSTTVR